MILCIGERIHKPAYRADLRRWDDYWRMRWCDENRLRHIMGMPAMSEGPTRNRLLSWGLPPDVKIVNLLWPHGEPGSWDDREATRSAITVLGHLGTPQGLRWRGLYLLGRRVADAFGLPPEADWGTRWSAVEDGCWTRDERGFAMLLPHPSGRSRVMNDEVLKMKMTMDVEKFNREHMGGFLR